MSAIERLSFRVCVVTLLNASCLFWGDQYLLISIGSCFEAIEHFDNDMSAEAANVSC